LVRMRRGLEAKDYIPQRMILRICGFGVAA